jgi:2,4-diketo-3-deoxy-L-fuconate hydrolase
LELFQAKRRNLVLKLVRCRVQEREHYGVLINDKVILLPHLAKRLNEKLPELFEQFIALGANAVETAGRLLEKATENDVKNASSLVDGVTLLAPVSAPPKIVCLGLNYRDHAEEQNAAIPDEPIIFMKPHTTIIGPNEKIVKPSFVKQLDYEAELAVVMGKKPKTLQFQKLNHTFSDILF